MKLSRRIADAGLSEGALLRLLQVLRAVAACDGQLNPDEQTIIDRLLPGAGDLAGTPSPLDALWPHKELAVTACIYVAVSDGEYGVEEARVISGLAHQLGLSAHQLGQLEERIFRELAERGRSRSTA